LLRDHHAVVFDREAALQRFAELRDLIRVCRRAPKPQNDKPTRPSDQV